MAQTPDGARKIAARKAGVSVEEYAALRDAGRKWCYACKVWRPVIDYQADRSRSDGLACLCIPCRTGAPSAEGKTVEEARAERLARKSRLIKETIGARPEPLPSPMKGRKMSVESRRKMSEARKGRPGPWKGKRRSDSTRLKISEAVRLKVARGPDHYAYSHGKHQRDLCDRRTVEYRRWRDAVYARDGYTCQDCGDAKGGNLQAHHVKSFADHPALRFDVSNGKTLCRDCHERLHLKPIPGFRCRRKKHPMPAASD
jgi:5-methylcytosine-specific restriction endonuclease McrA